MKDVIRIECFVFVRLSLLVSPYFLHNLIVLLFIEAMNIYVFLHSGFD